MAYYRVNQYAKDGLANRARFFPLTLITSPDYSEVSCELNFMPFQVES
jgi:hypothetical protein